MAYGATAATSSPPPPTSSYRVKFRKKEFVNLIKIASPEFIFHVDRMYFFAFQGYTVYSLECNYEEIQEFHLPILEAIEFSNTTWRET